MVISSNYEETIRLFITCYSFEDLRWPSVLCHTCRNLIVETKAKAKAETKEQSGNSSADKQRTKHTYDYQKITSNSITQNKVYNVKKHKHFVQGVLRQEKTAKTRFLGNLNISFIQLYMEKRKNAISRVSHDRFFFVSWLKIPHFLCTLSWSRFHQIPRTFDNIVLKTQCELLGKK